MEVDKKETYKKILKVAQDLIIQKPYHSVSLNMIARGAGVSKPSLYYYFKNKEDLFLKIFEEVSQEFDQELSKVLEKDLECLEKLHFFIETYINFFFVKKNLIRILLQRICKEDKNLFFKIRETREGIVSKLEIIMTEVLKKEGRGGDLSPRLASMMVLGMLGTFYVEYIEEEKKIELSPGQAADQIFSFLGFKIN